jgi:hypothetical protein
VVRFAIYKYLSITGWEFITPSVVSWCERKGRKCDIARSDLFNLLTPEEISILDKFFSEVGHLNSKKIIDKMHHYVFLSSKTFNPLN